MQVTLYYIIIQVLTQKHQGVHSKVPVSILFSVREYMPQCLPFTVCVCIISAYTVVYLVVLGPLALAVVFGVVLAIFGLLLNQHRKRHGIDENCIIIFMKQYNSVKFALIFHAISVKL